MARTSCAALVIVFAKAPRAGTVKTRLIPLLGAEGAATLHCKLLAQTLATVVEADLGPVELHGAPDARDPRLLEAARHAGVALLPQQGADLGDRMCNAFNEALSRHSRVIIVGTDCPVLEMRHLHEAVEALNEGNDAVFVPAEDGGYALIGLSQCDALLFEGMAWGTETVMDSTRQRLRHLKWRWRELETLWDIDRPEDYRRWSELVLVNENSRLA
jgi:rSAM/selenodomain-associated transferase 1